VRAQGPAPPGHRPRPLPGGPPVLEQARCDIAFLAAGPGLVRLYEKLDFRWLGRFTYLNARGELKETDDGMVAPVCSRERFEQVLAGEEVLHLGPEGGYW
jgi:hypothetical protein